MSIEKMIMVDIISHKDKLENLSENILFSHSMQLENPIREISMTKGINSKGLFDWLDKKIEVEDLEELMEIVKKMQMRIPVKNKYKIKNKDLIFEFEVLKKELLQFNLQFERIYNEVDKLSFFKEQLEKRSYIESIKEKYNELNQMKNFKVGIYKCLKDQSFDKCNYIVLNIKNIGIYKIIMIIEPSESNNSFPNCEKLNIVTELNCEYLLANLLKIKEKEKQFVKHNFDKIQRLYKSLEIQVKANKIKENSIAGNNLAYLCGWVPEGKLQTFKENLYNRENLLIILEKNIDAFEKPIVPPTILKNNWLFRPFEKVVKMYGLPTYGEIDPTSFLAITYMILFAAMFGDLGQGLVLMLFGLLLKNKRINKRPILGALLIRLGITSSIFGILYGSFFGFENIIPALLIRPMGNIILTLIIAVIFGIFLLSISYILSFINKIKNNNLEEGLFGKEGACGFLLYLSILALAIEKLTKNSFYINMFFMVIIATLILTLLFKEPMTNLIKRKNYLYNESIVDYYIEAFFSLIEAFIGFFSNTISFIRVGAFAINHVGLFMAFSTLALMINNTFFSICIYILGNIVILTLECVVVFIQGLRLEYYELFGKFYDGAGVDYDPISLSNP